MNSYLHFGVVVLLLLSLVGGVRAAQITGTVYDEEFEPKKNTLLIIDETSENIHYLSNNSFQINVSQGKHHLAFFELVDQYIVRQATLSLDVENDLNVSVIMLPLLVPTLVSEAYKPSTSQDASKSPKNIMIRGLLSLLVLGTGYVIVKKRQKKSFKKRQ
ncbi:MAG: hypothetical protein H6502_00930 [Candidatus Woesearchaeota archaeon]|nr:MAG: hypothetical protein H6502_00930 [Candidatus Woesearchaeota archaeon]